MLNFFRVAWNESLGVHCTRSRPRRNRTRTTSYDEAVDVVSASNAIDEYRKVSISSVENLSITIVFKKTVGRPVQKFPFCFGFPKSRRVCLWKEDDLWLYQYWPNERGVSIQNFILFLATRLLHYLYCPYFAIFTNKCFQTFNYVNVLYNENVLVF